MAHVVYLPDLQTAQAGEKVPILGPEAHHAVRVKRCETGDRIGLRNGRGLLAEGRVGAINKSGRGEWQMMVEVTDVTVAPQPVPRVEMCTSPPKGDHLSAMIDGLSQTGVAAWFPLRTARTVVEPRSGKLERLERVCEESLKQCGRAWLMEVGTMIELDDALRTLPGTRVIIADQSGEAWDTRAPAIVGVSVVRMLVGPEGGFTDEELARARSAGAVVTKFGPHAMRIETAAVIAGACAMMRTSS
jgi:16S rRNA (uracil1498-N3)-methyltransferase